MLAFFRRLINSKVGVLVTFGVLAVIALAFAAGDVTGLHTGGAGLLGGNGVATVGGTSIGSADLRSRAENEMQSYRQQQPTLTLAQYVAQGGLDATLERVTGSLALETFGHKVGMVASKRLVDGQLASIPGLQGLNGQFDPMLYRRILAERHLTDAQIRTDIARDLISQQLVQPTLGSGQIPAKLALPYASLMLERRSGEVAFIPAAAVKAGAAPTPAELQTFYQRNIARYSWPQRRAARYAVVTPDAVKARATPTDAEIAQAYAAQRARFQPKQTRTLTQVVVADQAGANALAAKVRGGMPFAAAAQAAGLAAATQKDVEKATYANATAPAVADAAFAATQGAVVGPIRSPLGWTVVRVDAVTDVAGKTLEQAKPELVTELTKQKTQQALADIHDAIDNALSKNANFDEVVADQKLQPRTTPAVASNGTDPAASTPAEPTLAPIVTAVFQAEEGDAPQLVPMGADGSFAVVGLAQVLPAAPRPLASVQAQVTRDYAADRARAAARQVAAGVVSKVSGGAALAQALAQTGLTLPPVEPVSIGRAELARNPQGPSAPLALLFSIPQGTTRLLESPRGDGWLIVKLDRVMPGNAAGNAGLVQAARSDLGRLNGQEYVQQFVNAVRKQVGVKIDKGAVARLKADIANQGGSDN